MVSKNLSTSIVMNAISLHRQGNQSCRKGRQSQTKTPAEGYLDDAANLEAAAKSPSEYNVKMIIGNDKPKHPYESDDDLETSPKAKKQDSRYVFFHGTQPA